MSKLWVFGDSYSVPITFLKEPFAINAKIDQAVYTTNWIEEVEKKINPEYSLDKFAANKPNVISQFGISNEWILKQVFEQFNSFSPQDCVIIQLTNSNRHWWFPELETESNLTQMISHPDWSKEKKKAIELHLKYLQNDNMDDIIYSAMIYSFMHLKVAMPQINLLLLPGWGLAPETIGNLTDNVCDAEFDNVETQRLFYEKTNYDCRLNHMSIDNHYILADKVCEYFINQTPVDLTTGFVSNIYTKENI